MVVQGEVACFALNSCLHYIRKVGTYMVNNAANSYKNNKIMTATPAELTLMLYDGAVKFCNIALMAFEKNDYTKVNDNIIKVENIITEFRSTLDFKYPVANDFEVVYDYIYRRLVDANIKKDPEILNEALKYIKEMRETWQEVMKINKNQGSNE